MLFSLEVHFFILGIRTNLKGYFSYTANSIHFQRVKNSTWHPLIPLSMAESLVMLCSWWASLLSSNTLLAPLSQHCSNQVTTGSFGYGEKSFLKTWITVVTQPLSWVVTVTMSSSSYYFSLLALLGVSDCALFEDSSFSIRDHSPGSSSSTFSSSLIASSSSFFHSKQCDVHVNFHPFAGATDINLGSSCDWWSFSVSMFFLSSSTWRAFCSIWRLSHSVWSVSCGDWRLYHLVWRLSSLDWRVSHSDWRFSFSAWGLSRSVWRFSSRRLFLDLEILFLGSDFFLETLPFSLETLSPNFRDSLPLQDSTQ